MCWEMSAQKQQNIKKKHYILLSSESVGFDIHDSLHSVCVMGCRLSVCLSEALGWNQFGPVSQPSPLTNDTEVTKKHASIILNRVICTKSYLIAMCAGISSKAKLFLGEGKGGVQITLSHTYFFDLPLELMYWTDLQVSPI